ncbi:sensor histidine kinase [Cohnella zeiphila]|uniref:histidine kinase n=1 Tax=Cohnella zeiphila TaxID=2761120 RepID=A0A7X0SQT7_9BACL|nr:sensor histidine kinase [Cohnella zeiphila]MBB6734359.1 sensor histidine kinase [Cohnella zeiphila]
MTFGSYLRDRLSFLLLFAAVMAFVGLMMALTSVDIINVMYTLIVCCLMTAIYLIAGYFRRRPFYRELEDRVRERQPDVSVGWPAPLTAEQALFMDVLRLTQENHHEHTRKLQQEIKDHQDFILSWIHEVKLPISASRLLLERNSDEAQEELADRLEDELDKIDHYVEQALYFSRIDSFSRDYFLTEVLVPAVVKGSVKKYAKLFIARRIRFRLQEGDLSVHSDAKWLGFMIDQIMANALKYTPEGGEIAAGFEEDDREKRLTIADTGIGIAPEELARVFEKGFTGSNGRSRGAKSTGMGLYLARQMALKLGHDLSVQSEVGAGTRLTVHFPKFRTYLNV